MLRFGVIGYGYWGPNIVRNLRGLPSSKVVAICDKRPESLQRVRQAYPDISVTDNADELLTSPDIDAIAVITPVWTHFDLTQKALRNGKHVFVEKPFTSTSDQARRLIDLADSTGLIVMLDHTFLFTGAVQKIKHLIDDGTLGKLYYYDSTRVNLGLFQHDVNVLWDLAPHDLSIMDYLIRARPEGIVASGGCHLNNGNADVAYMTIYFPDNVIAHLNVNWLSPVKIRMTLIGGHKKMLVWNDLEVDEKIKVYDRGVKIADAQDVYQALVSYRSGDMWAPKVEATEALTKELGYFIECIEHNQRPFNDGPAGLRVVEMLEAAERSLKQQGEMVMA